MKSRVLTAAFLISFLFAQPVEALDIPLLTWEQGKSQSVVLGGPTAAKDWKVVLYSDNGYESSFSASKINKAGFKVYSINLPTDLPEGSYVIRTEGPRSEVSTVAQVLVVPLAIYEVPSAPIDLLVLLLLLGLFVAAITAKRNYRLRIPSHIDHLYDLTKLTAGDELVSVKKLDFNSIEKKRAQFLDSIPSSTLKRVLLLDANILLNAQRRLYWILPTLGLILGCVMAFAHIRDANFFTTIDFFLLLLISVVATLDLFSSLIALSTYLALSFALQEGFGIREFLFNVAFAGTFVIPTLFFLVGFLLAGQEGSKVTRFNFMIPFLGVLYLPWSYFMVRSLGKVDDFSLSKCGLLIVLLLGLLFQKKQMSIQFLAKEVSDSAEERVKEFQVNRVVSPNVVAAFGLLMFAIYFNWTQSLSDSLVGALAWSSVMALTNLRFESPIFLWFHSLPRSEIIELLLVGVGMYAVFAFMKIQPLLVQDRSSIMLSVFAFPLILHGLYVMVAESGRLQESFSE